MVCALLYRHRVILSDIAALKSFCKKLGNQLTGTIEASRGFEQLRKSLALSCNGLRISRPTAKSCNGQ